jgi:hypothetical protein
VDMEDIMVAIRGEGMEVITEAIEVGIRVIMVIVADIVDIAIRVAMATATVITDPIITPLRTIGRT